MHQRKVKMKLFPLLLTLAISFLPPLAKGRCATKAPAAPAPGQTQVLAKAIQEKAASLPSSFQVDLALIISMSINGPFQVFYNVNVFTYPLNTYML